MRNWLSALALCAAAPLMAQTPPPAAAAPMDYARPESWLCRPGAKDPCATADLRLSDLGLAPTPAATSTAPPAIDCFYVYPTVSRQPAGNADGTLTSDESYVAQQQFARFRDVCRTFAPLYRQVTLSVIAGQVKGDGELAYADVKAAWNRYLANDNAGRGVILIGHSQGTRHLQRLVREEISGKPVQQRLVAAYLIGINIAVPSGADAKAESDLGAVPLCTQPAQTGCAVAYVTFPAAAPPPADARFGRLRDRPDHRVACVNPAAIGGEGRATSIIPVRSRPLREGDQGRQLIPGDWKTPSLRLNGLYTARCVDEGGAQYLAVSSQLPALETGLQALVQPDATWGLHVVDVNLFQGDLLRLAAAHRDAWVAGQRR